MLHHWDEKIEVIHKGPSGKFSGEKMNTHPFVHNVCTILAYADITKDIFKVWVKEIGNSFIQKNVLSMDRE